MGNNIYLTQGLLQKLTTITFTEQSWIDVGINSLNDLHQTIIEKINICNPKLSIRGIIEGTTTERSDNFGFIQNIESGKKIGYIFVIPPLTDSRSGFLAQHVYPAHTSIVNGSLSSYCLEPYNMPVYIVNLNEFNITPSKTINIRGAITIGFRYIDVFNRAIPDKFSNLFELDTALKAVNDQNENQYFDINLQTKSIVLKENTLGSGTNDRYFFSAKGYPAIYLASISKFRVDYTQFAASQSSRNSTLEALINYAQKLNSIL